MYTITSACRDSEYETMTMDDDTREVIVSSLLQLLNTLCSDGPVSVVLRKTE